VLAPPGWRLGGALAADTLQIAGTRAEPAVTGTLSADGMALRSVVDGLQFQDGRLRARLDGTRLLIDEFSLAGAGGAASGGVLRATGEAAWRDGRAQARLNATLQRLRVSVRDDRQLSVSGTLQRRPGRPRRERRRAPERGPGADRAARRQPPGAG
jgi:translocation and assembly module TamB